MCLHRLVPHSGEALCSGADEPVALYSRFPSLEGEISVQGLGRRGGGGDLFGVFVLRVRHCLGGVSSGAARGPGKLYMGESAGGCCLFGWRPWRRPVVLRRKRRQALKTVCTRAFEDWVVIYFILGYVV